MCYEGGGLLCFGFMVKVVDVWKRVFDGEDKVERSCEWEFVVLNSGKILYVFVCWRVYWFLIDWVFYCGDGVDDVRWIRNGGGWGELVECGGCCGDNWWLVIDILEK